MESFAHALKRTLDEHRMTASEAARLVEFRSRNSIFRILQGATREDVNVAFLGRLRQAVGDAWPQDTWQRLADAIEFDRLGEDAYRSKRAFKRLIYGTVDAAPDVMVQTVTFEGDTSDDNLRDVLADVIRTSSRVEVVLTSCCEGGFLRLLEMCCGQAADAGKLTVRHYIDVTEDVVVSNILGILPLVNKPWYNARLVDRSSCPEQMMQLYRLHGMYINCWDAEGRASGHQMTGIGENHFLRRIWQCPVPLVQTLDRWRFHLALLKPPLTLLGDARDYLTYTLEYGKLEDKCTILSIKPDVHFNTIAPQMLYGSIRDGLVTNGLAASDELLTLMDALWQVHHERFTNLLGKRKPTHLVYSISAMEQFMRSGVTADQFFALRPFTVQERRQIIQVLIDGMRSKPWFNVHFLKDGVTPNKEVSLYGDRGVMIMDASTSYNLGKDHSEALITLPAFVDAYRSFFMDSLLTEAVTSRSESLEIMERMLTLPIF